MSCKDCNCGKKERELATGIIESCGLSIEDIDALVKQYEEGDITREDFLEAITGTKV